MTPKYLVEAALILLTMTILLLAFWFSTYLWMALVTWLLSCVVVRTAAIQNYLQKDQEP